MWYHDMAVVSYEDNDFANLNSGSRRFTSVELGRMGCISMDRLLREGSIPMITTINDFDALFTENPADDVMAYGISRNRRYIAADKILDELTWEFHEIIVRWITI